jgi:hypothetical protein
MEHISNQLQNLQIEKAPAQTNSLKVSGTTLPALRDPDHKMIQLKYQSKQIGVMTAQEMTVWGKALLLKIHVITGWTIPEKELLVILVDQFQKKLVESYPDMNVDEIEYAFRQSGTTVKDWGKAMNLSLIDEVLIPYLGERKILSHELEERKVPPPEQKVLTDKQLEDLQRADIEAFYQRCRNGRTPYCLPDYFKEILVKDGLMKQEDQLSAFFMERLGKGIENIYVPI